MRILLCETDSGMLEILSIFLVLRDYQVTVVSDPSDLPAVSGYDVLLTNCEEILHRGIPTLFISATQARCESVAQLGVPVLQKPFDAEVLIETLKKVCTRNPL